MTINARHDGTPCAHNSWQVPLDNTAVKGSITASMGMDWSVAMTDGLMVELWQGALYASIYGYGLWAVESQSTPPVVECRLIGVPGKTHLRDDLLCVQRNVKLYSLTRSLQRRSPSFSLPQLQQQDCCALVSFIALPFWRYRRKYFLDISSSYHREVVR